MHAAGRAGPFASGIGPPLKLRRHAAIGPVVSEKQDERILSQAQFIKLLHQSADQLVHISRHVGEMFQILVDLFALGGGIPDGAVGRRLEGIVGQHQRIVPCADDQSDSEGIESHLGVRWRQDERRAQ